MISPANIDERSSLFYGSALRWEWDALPAALTDLFTGVVAATPGTIFLNATTWTRNVQGIAFSAQSNAGLNADSGITVTILVEGEDQFSRVVSDTIFVVLGNTNTDVTKQSTYAFRKLTKATLVSVSAPPAGALTLSLGFSLMSGLVLPAYSQRTIKSSIEHVRSAVAGVAAQSYSVSQAKASVVLTGTSTAGKYVAHLKKADKLTL